jgi:GDP/UDP-N,N'-diacetylbacillosamine 2-epimerase (hydrolysing)
VRRDGFLALLRDTTVLVGNSSTGIVEAASFGTPVIDIGSRQLGRERSQNVTNVPYRQDAIARALNRIWNAGRPIRSRVDNIYASPNTSRRIAQILASARIDQRLSRKLIAY